jgi:hypothetical protein
MASYHWGQASPSSPIRSASLVRRTACQLIQARKASTLAANLAPPGSHPADRITDRTRQNRARGRGTDAAPLGQPQPGMRVSGGAARVCELSQ